MGSKQPTDEYEYERERMMEEEAHDLPFKMHSQTGPNWAVIGALALIGLAIPAFYIALSLISGLVTSWSGIALAVLVLAVALSVGLGGFYVLFRSAKASSEEELKGDDLMKVSEVMSRNPVKCGTIDSIEDAAKVMYRENVGYLLVQDEKDQYVGCVTDRDIVCAAVANAADVRNTPITTIMERNFRFCGPDASIDDCLDIMKAEGIRRVPILEDNNFLGVVSVDDLIAHEVCSIEDIAPIFRRQQEEPNAQHEVSTPTERAA